MKAAPFEYSRATDIDEACAMLAADDGARVIAGGQTLVPMMAMRLARPTRIIDIDRSECTVHVRVGCHRSSLRAQKAVTFNLDMPVPSQQRVALTGIDGSGVVRFLPRWGATVDGTYASTGNVFNPGHGPNILSLLAGPVFYPVNGRTAVFLHALVGAGRVGGAVPTSGPYYLGGWVARPSYAFGGGVERYLFGTFAVRLQADYQRTTFGMTGRLTGCQATFPILMWTHNDLPARQSPGD